MILQHEPVEVMFCLSVIEKKTSGTDNIFSFLLNSLFFDVKHICSN